VVTAFDPPTLFDAALNLRKPLTIEAYFEQFHAANPHVYRRLVEMTRQLVERGHKKVGIGVLFEALRWEHAMTTADPETPFKLNNSLRSRYARRIMDDHPDLEGVFETRELKAA